MEREQPYLGDLPAMVINHLHPLGWSSKPFQYGTLEHKVYIIDFCKFSLERRPVRKKTCFFRWILTKRQLWKGWWLDIPSNKKTPGIPSENGFMGPKYLAFRFGNCLDLIIWEYAWIPNKNEKLYSTLDMKANTSSGLVF